MRMLGVLLLLGAAQVAVAAQGARQWLDEMSTALQTLNYDGTFVYLHDGKMEAMRIVHRLGSQGESERLVSLTGSAREVIRDDESVTCIMPDNKSVMVGQSRPRQPFPAVPRDIDALLKYYQLEDMGDDRMAGLMTRVIAIAPRDAFRYGYRFWIDKESKMLLKSDLTTANGQSIEQMMFTRLEVGGEIPEQALQPSLSGKGFEWHRQGSPAVRMPTGDADIPQWQIGRIPVGFGLTHYQRKRMKSGNGGVEHMVFSDGLATVSVYVEQASRASDVIKGLSGMGAMNAYSSVVDGHQVTVVGEVPAATVEMIALSARREP